MCTALSCLWLLGRLKLCLGPEAKTVRQSDPGLVLRGEWMYLLVLPYSHDSVAAQELVCLVACEETKANVCFFHYTSLGRACIIRPGQPITAGMDSIRQLWTGIWHKGIGGGQFHQDHLQAAGRSAEENLEQNLVISVYFQLAVCWKSFMQKSIHGD